MEKKYILIGYRNPSIRLYTPQRNKKKLGILAGLFVISLIVPFMTTAVIGSFKILTKYRPLWLYS